jgi:hypothetical protein
VAAAADKAQVHPRELALLAAMAAAHLSELFPPHLLAADRS